MPPVPDRIPEQPICLQGRMRATASACKDTALVAGSLGPVPTCHPQAVQFLPHYWMPETARDSRVVLLEVLQKKCM